MPISPSILHPIYAGAYRLDTLLEESGSFSIYAGKNIQDGQQLLIRELFLPAFMERREDGTVSLFGISKQDHQRLEEDFLQKGLWSLEWQHPYLAKTVDVFKANDTAYFVSKRPTGKTLEEWISINGRMTEEMALRCVNQVGTALIYLHSKGVLHQDIRPSNIFFEPNTQQSVLGSFCVEGLSLPEGRTIPACLHPNYAPIEHYIGNWLNNSQLKIQSDIYGLGGILYYCLTGQHPLSSVDRQSIKMSTASELCDNLSDASQEALTTAMAMQVEERFQSVYEFLDALPTPSKKREEKLLTIGDRFKSGRYEVRSYLGESTTGQTYKAFDLQAEKNVAIRVFHTLYPAIETPDKHPDQSTDSNEDLFDILDAAHFEQVANNLKKLALPHSCEVTDVFRQNESSFAVLTFAPGITLLEHMAKNAPIKETNALRLLGQLLQQLSYFHTEKIAHNDVGPYNLVITNSGKRCNLIGFGISAPSFQYQQLSNPNALGRYYHAPECFIESITIDPIKTDIYACGAVLLYMLTGKHPTDSLSSYGEGMDRNIDKFDTLISDKVALLIRKAMNNHPDQRFKHAGEMYQAIQAINQKMWIERLKKQWPLLVVFLLFLLLSFLCLTLL